MGSFYVRSEFIRIIGILVGDKVVNSSLDREEDRSAAGPSVYMGSIATKISDDVTTYKGVYIECSK